jgi:vang-like
MEPDTYCNSLNSALPITSMAGPGSIAASMTSSHTTNYETRSSSRRHQHHQHAKKRSNDGKATASTTINNHDERIEVKILPQDDNWGETTTITCHGGNEDTLTNNNDTSLQLHDNHHVDHGSVSRTKKCHRSKSSLSISNFLGYLFYLIVLISPIFFLTLPFVLVPSDSITIDDYSPLLIIAFKLLLLVFGACLLFHRRRNTSTLPRIHMQKSCLIILLLAILLAYWFYYIWKLLRPKMDNYERILSLTSTYEDLLLFVFILAVLILEVKWFYPKWIVKIVRSPDGQTRQYTIGRCHTVVL